jgi:hypothetical protein
MANSGRLEIEIGADVSGLEQGISQAEKQLRTLESRRDARIKIGADTTDLDRRISGVSTRLNELRTSAAGAQTAMRGMTGQVGNGSNALMQFSRIAQDAPYGIIGIGNNLTATAEAFGHLRNQTGSAGGALKAMASSLMGTGGILLGVSLLTTGFTLLAQSGLSVGDIIDKITGDFDEAAASVKKLGLEAAKTAGTEISELKALVSVAQKDTKSREERLIAVKKLQSEFPAYFGNLSTEKILNGDVTKSIENVSEALKARARASAIYGKVGELSAKRLELEEKREQAITKLKEAQKASDADSSVYAAGLRFNLKGAVDNYKSIVQEIQNVDKNITKLQSKANVDTTASILLNQEAPKQAKANKQDNSSFELEKQRLERIIAINKAILENDNTGYYGRLGAQKAFSNAQISLIEITKNNELKNTQNTENDKLRIIEDAANKTVDAKKNLADRLKGIQLFSNQDFSRGNLFDSFSTNIAPTLPPIALTFTDPTEGFLAFNAKAKLGLTEMELLLADFNKNASELIEGSLVNTFSGIGDAIGNAIATGGNVLSAIGNSLLSSLGAFLSDMGGMLIKYGLLAIAKGKIDLAILTGGPVSIGAGIAAVGVGLLLKAAGASIGNMARSGGSNSSSSTSSGSGANNSTRVSGGFSGSGGFGSGTVVFEIAGTSLIGVLNNTQARNLRIGGN